MQDPNIGEEEETGEEGEKREFYENSEEEDEDEEKLVIDENKVVKPLYKMDPDHRSVGCTSRREPFFWLEESQAIHCMVEYAYVEDLGSDPKDSGLVLTVSGIMNLSCMRI
jgi:hypothetical protein